MVGGTANTSIRDPVIKKARVSFRDGSRISSWGEGGMHLKKNSREE